MDKNKMPPPVQIFSKKMDDKQVMYFMWPNHNHWVPSNIVTIVPHWIL